MGFERITAYEKKALEYTGDKSDINALALQLRASCGWKWIKVSNNSKSIWAGEQRKIIVNERGKKETWMYKIDNNFDPVLYAVLYSKFRSSIQFFWHKVRGLVDIDEYLDATENFFIQTIRRFDGTKASFKTLFVRMLNNCAINIIAENSTAEKVLNPTTGKTSRIFKRKEKPLSLEEIMEDPENPLFYRLPETSITGITPVQELKDLYRAKGDFISWSIVDWEDDNSLLMQQKELRPLLRGIQRLNINNIKALCTQVLDNPDILKKLNFSDCSIYSFYQDVRKSSCTEDEKKNILSKEIRKRYRISMSILKRDVKEYILQ